MTAIDVLLEHLIVKLLRLRVVAGEALVGVGDEDTTVAGTLHGTEDTGTRGSALETDIKVALEWPGRVLIVESLNLLDGTVGLSLTLVFLSKTKLGQCATSAEKTGRVGWDCV